MTTYLANKASIKPISEDSDILILFYFLLEIEKNFYSEKIRHQN